jgi:hypothetical protein
MRIGAPESPSHDTGPVPPPPRHASIAITAAPIITLRNIHLAIRVRRCHPSIKRRRGGDAARHVTSGLCA